MTPLDTNQYHEPKLMETNITPIINTNEPKLMESNTRSIINMNEPKLMESHTRSIINMNEPKLMETNTIPIITTNEEKLMETNIINCEKKQDINIVKKKKQFEKQPDLQLPPGIDQIIGQMKAPMSGLENMMQSEDIAQREQFESDTKFQKSLFSMKL
jgi:hypothetical protein